MCNNFIRKRTHNTTHLIDLRFGKYTEVHNAKNIVVGQGELVYVEEQKGWIDHFGNIIRNKVDAIKIATQINKLYNYNLKRITRSKIKF